MMPMALTPSASRVGGVGNVAVAQHRACRRRARAAVSIARASTRSGDDGDGAARGELSTLDALARTLSRDEDDGVDADARVEGTGEDVVNDASKRAEEVRARRVDEVRRERARRETTPEGPTTSWKPWWSPLSTVYNVPTIEPAGAYFLAMLHAGAFVADLALLKLGYGNGGDVFLKLALFDNAVVYDSQWVRCFTACLVDFGLLHFATVNLALVTIGAEAEAILGTSPFLTVYILSAAMGGIGSMALDPSTLHVTSSDGLFGVFGAMLVYAAINVENEWNMKGFTVRLLYCGAFASALQYLTSVPTEDGGHVVNSVGHLWGFVAGIAMGYTGLSPMFTSKRFETPPEDRMNVVDVTSGPPKTFAALGALSFTILSLCVVVLLKRTLDVDPRDVF